MLRKRPAASSAQVQRLPAANLAPVCKRPAASITQPVDSKYQKCENVLGERLRVKVCKHVEQSHYSVLGIPCTATEEEIRIAFKAQALKTHPDKPGGDAVHFRRVVKAWTVLSTKESRARYDLDSSHHSFADAHPDPCRQPLAEEKQSMKAEARALLEIALVGRHANIGSLSGRQLGALHELMEPLAVRSATGRNVVDIPGLIRRRIGGYWHYCVSIGWSRFEVSIRNPQSFEHALDCHLTLLWMRELAQSRQQKWPPLTDSELLQAQERSPDMEPTFRFCIEFRKRVIKTPFTGKLSLALKHGQCLTQAALQGNLQKWSAVKSKAEKEAATVRAERELYKRELLRGVKQELRMRAIQLDDLRQTHRVDTPSILDQAVRPFLNGPWPTGWPSALTRRPLLWLCLKDITSLSAAADCTRIVAEEEMRDRLASFDCASCNVFGQQELSSSGRRLRMSEQRREVIIFRFLNHPRWRSYIQRLDLSAVSKFILKHPFFPSALRGMEQLTCIVLPWQGWDAASRNRFLAELPDGVRVDFRN